MGAFRVEHLKRPIQLGLVVFPLALGLSCTASHIEIRASANPSAGEPNQILPDMYEVPVYSPQLCQSQKPLYNTQVQTLFDAEDARATKILDTMAEPATAFCPCLQRLKPQKEGMAVVKLSTGRALSTARSVETVGAPTPMSQCLVDFLKDTQLPTGSSTMTIYYEYRFKP